LLEYGCGEEEITVHYSGIDLSKFKSKDYPEDLLFANTVKLYSVGRLVEKKGIEYAIRPVAELMKTGYRVRYPAVGDGELMADLKRLVDALGAAAHVRFVGAKGHDEVLGLLQSHHIMLAPSVTGSDNDQEGIPNELKEAMAMGVPVVSTVHSGIPELVEDGVSGFLVRERDVSGMADRLAHLIDHRELWPVMGRAGRVRVEEYFNSAQLNKRLIGIFCERIAGRKG
jgi:colanic acid/amylovoran biosynthesis glycosyltransferase